MHIWCNVALPESFRQTCELGQTWHNKWNSIFYWSGKGDSFLGSVFFQAVVKGHFWSSLLLNGGKKTDVALIVILVGSRPQGSTGNQRTMRISSVYIIIHEYFSSYRLGMQGSPQRVIPCHGQHVLRIALCFATCLKILDMPFPVMRHPFFLLRPW